MTHNITKVRAALECAKSAAKFCVLPGLDREADEGLAALAKLEKAAGEPLFILTTGAIDSDGEQDDWDIECDSSRRLESFCAAHPEATVPLYAAPIATAPQFVAGEVTRPMCHGAWARFWSEPNTGDSCDQARRWLEAWRSELGPALGLVEIREPTDDECRDIWREAKANEGDGSKVCAGRAMFDACRAVMWPKEGL